jgi:DNA-binding transcriptional LysR family regulator
MELRQLRHFVAVAETCHFSRAAEQLHMAQPALSQSIRQLETELGTPLFARTTRTVSLTPAGDYLLDDARRSLALIDQGISGVRRIAAGNLGLVRIAFTGSAAFSMLPRLARILRREHPAIALDVQADMLTPMQVERISTHQLDLGVLRAPHTGDGLATRVIAVERMVLALPADHRLVQQPAITMADLRVESLICYADNHSAVNDAVARNCRQAGFEPHAEHSAPGTSVLLALVAGGLGVALVPESVLAMKLDGVVFREVRGAATSALNLAWRRDEPSDLVRRIIRTLDSRGFFSDRLTVNSLEALPTAV